MVFSFTEKAAGREMFADGFAKTKSLKSVGMPVGQTLICDQCPPFK